MEKRFDVEKIRSKKTHSHLDVCKVIYEETENKNLKKELGDLITKYFRKEVIWKTFHRTTLRMIIDSEIYLNDIG